METIALHPATIATIVRDMEMGEFDDGSTTKEYDDEYNGVQVTITTYVDDHLFLRDFGYKIIDYDKNKEYALAGAQFSVVESTLSDSLAFTRRAMRHYLTTSN